MISIREDESPRKAPRAQEADFSEGIIGPQPSAWVDGVCESSHDRSIVVGAFVLAAINEFVESLPLAVALEILLLAVAVAVGIFVWLR